MEYRELPCEGQTCAVETTLNILSGKWKGIILYRLMGGKLRFNELRRIMPAVTHRTLTLQLRELEADGIISRTVYAEVPPRVEYAMTPLGESMMPIIRAMYQWGRSYQAMQASAAAGISGDSPCEGEYGTNREGATS